MSNRKKRSAAHRAQGENHMSENFVSNCYCFRMSTKSKCKDSLEYGHPTYLPWISWLSICYRLASLCKQVRHVGRSQRRNLRILAILRCTQKMLLQEAQRPMPGSKQAIQTVSVFKKLLWVLSCTNWQLLWLK